MATLGTAYLNDEAETKVLNKILGPTGYSIRAFYCPYPFTEAYGYTTSGAYSPVVAVGIPIANWTITGNVATAPATELIIPANTTVHGIALVDSLDSKALMIAYFDTPLNFNENTSIMVKPEIKIKEEV